MARFHFRNLPNCIKNAKVGSIIGQILNRVDVHFLNVTNASPEPNGDVPHPPALATPNTKMSEFDFREAYFMRYDLPSSCFIRLTTD